MSSASQVQSEKSRTGAPVFSIVILVFFGLGFSTLPSFSQPTAPTGIRTWGLRDNKTKISWTDNAGDETEYRIERSTNGGSFSEIGTVPENEQSYIDSGFDTSDTYTYQVRAYRMSDDSFSSYTATSDGPLFLDSARFRMYYNTTGCVPTTGTSKHCTPSGNNGMGQNEYAARILDILEGSFDEFIGNFGFNDPYNPESPELLPVNLKYCDGGGCAGGCGIGLAPAYSDPYTHTTNTGDPGSLVVGAHELFHMIQFSYNALQTDPASSWAIEGQARAIQDLVCIDAAGIVCQNIDDDPASPAPYYGQVNAYLGNTDRPLNEVGYDAAIFWAYMCQEYGANLSEPERGLDFLEEFWNEADDDVNRDGIQVIDATLNNLGESDDFKEAFKNFVTANYTKQLTGPGVPSNYKYVDESQNPGAYDDVNLHVSEDLDPLEQIIDLSDVQKWGVVYHEFRIDPLVPFIQVDYSVDSPYPAFFALLAIKGDDLVYEERHEGFAFESSLANDEYEKVVVIVAGLDHDVNFRYAINGTQPIIRILDPLTGRKAIAGDRNAPEKFVAKVEVLDPDGNPIVGIDEDDFSFEVGPQSLTSGNIVTSAYVQGQYWFVIQAPTQTLNTTYDFVAGWSILSDTETNSVNYVMRADADNVLVIDRSGSMGAPASKIADAKDAAELYVDSWREGDMVGVVSFECDATPPELTLRDWDETSRMDAITEIESIGAGGGTSIGNGLGVGMDELIAGGDSSHTWALILLSDGNNTCEADIADFLEDYQARVDGGDQVPQVHTVAIGADANRPDLENLASVTGGTYHFAAEPPGAKGTPGLDFFRDMAEIYRTISERVSRQQQVLNQRGDSQRITPDIHPFTVDGGASELVATVRWEIGVDLNIVLRDPMGGTAYSPFVEIPGQHQVYRIGSPMPGEWQFEIVCAPGANQCIGPYIVEASVKSSLTADLFLTTPIEERIIGTPMPVLLSLTDSGPITGAGVLAASFPPDPDGDGNPPAEFRFLFDDGAHGDGSADDGIYGNVFHQTSTPGTYVVRVLALGTSMDFGPFGRTLLESFVMRDDEDIDKDRMPDGYERRVGLIVGVDDAGGDPDKDKLNNFQECSRGTDPFDPDTDDGGEGDGSEVFSQTPRNPHEPGDDKVKPPRIVGIPGVGRVFVDTNLPILSRSGDIDDVTYTFEVSRCVGDGTFEVYAAGVKVVTRTYTYVDTDFQLGVPQKYLFRMIGPGGEESAPSDIVTVTPTLDPFPPFGGILIDNGNRKTTSLAVDLTLIAQDGYDPDFDFPDKDEYDPNALISGLADMMICNKSDCSDGEWEPFMETKQGWVVTPNKMGIATVYAKFRDNAGTESLLYPASIIIVDGTSETPTPTVTPTGTLPEATPTPTGTLICDVTDEAYDTDDNGNVDANDLLRLLEDIKEGPFDSVTDFNCDGSNDMLDAFLMAEKWKLSLPLKAAGPNRMD